MWESGGVTKAERGATAGLDAYVALRKRGTSPPKNCPALAGCLFGVPYAVATRELPHQIRGDAGTIAASSTSGSDLTE